MPSPRPVSRSPSPYTKRASRSYRDERPRSFSPHRRFSCSPSPRSRHHNRSRSPRRRNDERPKKSGGGGIRWKEKSRYEDDERRDDRRLERGYREQERPRREPPSRDGGSRDERGRDDVEAKFGRQRSPVRKDAGKDDVKDKFGSGEKPRKEKDKIEKKPAMAPVGQEMIIVKVNDRLGTAAQIPCLASDPIKLFKAQVAARIGRQPHEIMLKRQGERPFKDQLTLEDYGVSNGVQLDLEIDTGD